MSGPAKDPRDRLRDDYAAAFLGYLNDRSEAGLRAAYELGRRAMSDPLGLLNLVRVHHDVLIRELHAARTAQEVREVGDAAAAFLLDALTSFQMTQLGYLEKTAHPNRDKPQR